ncbi:MAG TPA: hypothetical protein VFO29_03225 [Candidatus Rubrimentiphilum sp.]|nr:hypothetical protein [Candidatus Rubrimentiphilum sp.]
MKALRFSILAAVLASFVTAFGVSSSGAKETVKHRFEISVEFKNGQPVKEGRVDVFRAKTHFMLGNMPLDQFGTATFLMPDVEGKYCFVAFASGDGQQRRSDNECYEDEYPATVKLTIL